MDILFIQYQHPDGRQRSVWIDRPAAIACQAQRIWEAGYRLEAEILSNGLVSLTVSDNEGDYVMELHPNGEGLEDAVDRLIIRFSEMEFANE